MSEFHHVYNFIPTTGKLNNKDTLTTDYSEIKDGETHIRHDKWETGTRSGRIVARVHLKTPTVVGGQHEKREDGTTLVKPYQFNEKIAIPANSLRGMIGSIMETLSQSALRVLEKKQYSVRKEVSEGLSAIGMLRKNKENSEKWEILPLTVLTNLNGLWKTVLLEKKFNDLSRIAILLSGYTPIGNSSLRKSDFLAKDPELESFHGKNKVKFYYAKVAGNKVVDIKKEPSNGYVKGFLRILGIDGREKDMLTKRHEFFIPYPDGETRPDRIPLPDEVIENFITLAKERNAEDEDLPFVLKGYTQVSDKWQPEDGQLVFFDIKNEKGEIVVKEISYSSIWRKLIDGDSHAFFEQINKNLLPFNPNRDGLTPAECILGTIETIEKGGNKREGEKQARALASRVRFYDAQVAEGETVKTEKEVILKILSSPKPPCPAMYFHQNGDKEQRTFIKKTALKVGEHRPNGRKVYLHHKPTEKNWETKHKDPIKDKNASLDQKMRCSPMQAGQSFYFHIDFDNLTDTELSLLICSLYPSEAFQHRLGLGKPLGLGSVKIDIMGVFLIDRLKRYTADDFLSGNRYHDVVQGTDTDDKWQKNYPTEFDALRKQETQSPESYRKDNELIDETTLGLLNTVGNPANLKVEVKPPLTTKQTDDELETFEWFSENIKKGKGKALGLIKAGEKLPTFKVT
ncbi:CRISPR-associated protein [Beggiatoa alba B18LD]|uniref:CRISPR-associated protein n=1 Tax=Beggiatoa alba B18LD TaxID=395493 RepID=I3CJV2_9GAMM|nr:TIGR03986 family CRISPR-associated RAMP protein [Beggiatoa alba]EIJ43895.1 CRISPR-associated protein [Beggiatoa alba B18LD]